MRPLLRARTAVHRFRIRCSETPKPKVAFIVSIEGLPSQQYEIICLDTKDVAHVAIVITIIVVVGVVAVVEYLRCSIFLLQRSRVKFQWPGAQLESSLSHRTALLQSMAKRMP